MATRKQSKLPRFRELTEAERTRIKERWKMAVEAETAQRINEVADLEFESGEHWDQTVKNDRLAAGKPCLTMDLTSGPIKQVTNQMRQARPAIVVKPIGNGADVKKAQAWQGILRRIENRSNAEYAYIWAGQHQSKMGRGVWRILPDYCEPDSDLQDLKIQWVDNQHSVYLDPRKGEADGSDRRWGFIVEDLTHEDYKDRFGESALNANLGESFQSVGDAPPDWITKEHVRCVEYYEVVEEGRRGWSVGSVKSRTVKFMYTNGIEALEETTIPGRYIPIVEIEGERRNINGVVDRRGMVRMAKDPQRIVNFQESSIQQTISTGTKSRWLIAEGQTEGYEDMWATANRKDWDTLVYKDTSVSGKPSPPPMPIDREPPIQAMTMAAQRAAMQLKQNLGYVDVSSDEKRGAGDTVSGRAINARKLQQEMQSSDYMDNLGRGIKLTGRMLMAMVRETYDTPRLLRIMGADDKEYEIVTHAAGQEQQAQQLLSETAKELLDLSVGDYDVIVSAGKSYDSQRQEQADAMERVFAAMPEIAAQTLDLYFEAQDFPNAQKMAARLKKIIPSAQEDDQQTKIPPKVAQRLQQLDQYAQMAHETIETLTEEIKTKKLELESKERIAADDNLTKIQIAQMQLGVQQQIAEMQNHIQKLETVLGIVHETRMQEQEHAHEAGLTAMEAAHAKEQMDKQHEMGLVEGEVEHGRGLEAGEVEHGRNLEAGEVSHRQALEQSEVGHEHKVKEIKAQPKPKPAK
jgi:hypothetical protein